MDATESSGLFWALVGLSGGTGVTAYSIHGHKARNLWIACAVLMLAAILLRFGVPSLAARFAASAVMVLWAMYPALTVAAVAMVVRDRTPSPKSFDLADLDTGPPRPPFAAGPSHLNKWKPDISLRDAMVYLGTISRWSKASSSISETLDEMKSALWSNKVTAWGKAHPDDNDAHQIAQAFWQTTDVNWDTNYAFSKSRSLGVYDVHLSRGEIEQVWPPKEPPAPASA